MIFVFLIQFINTSIILLFINADLSQSGIPILDKIFVLGYHSDFTVEWYKDVGKIITTLMIKNISWPIIEFFIFYGQRMVKRILDKRWCRCCCKGKATRAKTIEAYIEIYSGPQYDIFYKYSSILNIVFVSFMYGAGIPILFPIAVLSLVVIYIKERLCLAYSYRDPKLMLDNSLNQTALNFLTIPPLIYSAFAYWMFNNIQIFTNEVFYLPFYSSTIITGQTLRTMMTHTIPVLIAFGISCTSSLLQKYFL